MNGFRLSVKYDEEIPCYLNYVDVIFSSMNTLAQDLKNFLAATGIRQYRIAEEAGVSTATINRLVKGVQEDMRLKTARSIRRAMRNLRKAAHSAKADTLPAIREEDSAGDNVHSSSRLFSESCQATAR